MITAYPTPSPVNVSATSTPLYYMTAYPSHNPNNETDNGFASILAKLPVSSNTATILGGVAVGLASLGGIAFAVHYMRNGGTLAGLMQKAKDNKGKLLAMTDQLPLTEAQKAALHNPTSLLPADVAAAIQNPQSLVDKLPVPDSLKEQINQVVPATPEALLAVVQDPAALKAHVQAQVHTLMEKLPVRVGCDSSLPLDGAKALPLHHVPDAIKGVVPTSPEALLAAVQDPAALTAHVQALVQAQVQAQMAIVQSQVQALVPADVVVAVAEEKKPE